MSINDRIYDFLNSKDIAEHLKSIDYRFSTLEAAYLVYKSNSRSLEEKFEAWEHIIKNMPDCQMKERRNTAFIPSFHSFLRDYMELQRKKLELFYDSNNAVYYYRLWHKKYETVPHNSQPFSSAEACFNAIRTLINRYEATNISLGYVCIDIQRNLLDKENDYSDIMVLKYNTDYSIRQIESNVLSDSEFDIDLTFEDMWFDIPTPFKKGDIVVACNRFGGNPFVLTSLCTENNWTERQKATADSSDMTYYGYSIWNDELHYDSEHDYLSLEYFRKPLEQENRVLHAVQLAVLDKINLVDFCLIKDTLLSQKDTSNGLSEFEYFIRCENYESHG